MQELRRQVPGLGEEEEADLGNVGPGRDVDEILLRIRLERIGARPVVERRVDRLEIARISHLHHVGPDLGLGRDLPDVFGDLGGQGGEPLLEQELEPVDQEILVLAHRHGRPPALPALPARPLVQGEAQGADATNKEGIPAYRLPPKPALAQYAATGGLSATFYASESTQLDAVLRLCPQVDADFIARTALYCRKQGAMKDMPASCARCCRVRRGPARAGLPARDR